MRTDAIAGNGHERERELCYSQHFFLVDKVIRPLLLKCETGLGKSKIGRGRMVYEGRHPRRPKLQAKKLSVSCGLAACDRLF